MAEQIEKLWNSWHQRVTLAQQAHFYSNRKFRRIKSIIDVIIVVFMVFVGAFLLSIPSNGNITNSFLLRTLGVMCLIPAILHSILVMLKLEKRADIHLAAAQNYGIIRREIESVLVSITAHREYKADFEVQGRYIIDMMDSAAKESPMISEKTWKRITTKFSDESFELTLSKQESIIAVLRRHGQLPIDFLMKSKKISKEMLYDILEELKRSEIIEIEGDSVFLKEGGAI